MAIRKMKLLFFMGLCFSLIMSCSLKKDNSKDIKAEAQQQANGSDHLDGVNPEDTRLAKLASLTFEEALKQDWNFVIRVVPVALDVDTDLGILIRNESSWIASYGGGFAACELVNTEIIRSDIIRFIVDIWQNADPDRPFAERQPNTPTYRFYVDLTESDFRAAVRKGILEKKQVVVIPVKAYNLAGEPVGEWFRDLPAGNAKKDSQ